MISHTSGSGTGTGAVLVNAGTLGGSGIIAGAVTVGSGSGTGAFLARAFASNKQVMLTLQSSLTFQADATYTYTFKAKKNSRAPIWSLPMASQSTTPRSPCKEQPRAG